jgi:hypothetical protein
MDSEVAALKAHIDAIVPTLATKADIEVLRAEMHKMSAEGYRWMVASMIGMSIGFGGLYFAANRSFDARPAAQAVPPAVVQGAPQPPVVIYLPQPQPQPQSAK